MSVVGFFTCFNVLCQLVLVIESSGVLSDSLQITMRLFWGKEKSYPSTRKRTFQATILVTVGDFMRDGGFSGGRGNFGSERSLQGGSGGGNFDTNLPDTNTAFVVTSVVMLWQGIQRGWCHATKQLDRQRQMKDFQKRQI